MKILMLTAKTTIDDKMEGFNNGADDYLTKPFHMEELMARVNVQLRKNTTLSFDIIDNPIEINDNALLYFNQFVKTYSVFKNEYEIESDNPNEIKAYEQIKRYKLASSEGVNKISNRVIRYEILKKIVFNIENIDIDVYKLLEEKFQLLKANE